MKELSSIISAATLLPIFLLLMALYCSAKGPPFADQSGGQALNLEGRYRFTPNLRFFSRHQRGELVLEKGRGKKKKSYFFLRIFGLNREGALRLRSYEGLAYRNGQRAELRAKRCYLYGKRDWEARLVPLERWDCEHLFFVYYSASDFTKREILLPQEAAESRYSDWFRAAPLIPMPAGFPKLKQKIFFAGQIIEPQERAQPNLAVVWGYKAGRLLRKGQILKAQNEEGRQVGKLKVLSRPGDFIICRWLTGSSQQAIVAFQESAPPAEESIFGF